MNVVECLGSFFKNILSPDFIRSVIIEAEEYVANVIEIDFDCECKKGLLRKVSVAIAYNPGYVKWIVIELYVTSQVEAYDFITRTYRNLLAKSYNVEISRENIRIFKRIGCRDVREEGLWSLVSEVMSELGDICNLRFSGTYSLHWYHQDFK